MRHSDCGQLFRRYLSIRKCLADDRQNALGVGPAGNFWNYAAEALMQTDLRMDHIGQDGMAVAHNRCRGFIARRFNAKDQFGHMFSMPENVLVVLGPKRHL